MSEREELIENIVSYNMRIFNTLKFNQDNNWLEVDLTMQQLKAMFILYTVERIQMRRLAELLGTSVTAITGLVDRLVDHGLVYREEDPDDRRLVLARLTSEGRDKVEKLHELKRDRLTRLLARLSTEELRVVSRASDLLIDAVLAEFPDALASEKPAERKANSSL